MDHIGVDDAQGSPRIRPRDGRHLYVGVGCLGKVVLERLQRSWTKSVGGLPRLTCSVLIDGSSIPFDVGRECERRDAHQAFADSEAMELAKKKIYEGIERCAAMPPMGMKSNDLSDEISIYIIADLGEALGSGVFLAVARLAKTVASARPNRIIGILRLCPAPKGRARAFSALRELETELGHGASAAPACEAGAVESTVYSCFDRCFLVGDSNGMGALAAEEQVAVTSRFLRRFCRGGVPGTTAPSDAAGGHQAVEPAAVGLSSAYFPQSELQHHCIRRWCAAVCEILVGDVRQARSPGTPSDANAEDLRKLLATEDLPKLPTVDELRREIDQHLTENGDWPPVDSEVRTRPPQQFVLPSEFEELWIRRRTAIEGFSLDVTDLEVVADTRESLLERLDNLITGRLEGIRVAQLVLARLVEGAEKAVEDVRAQETIAGDAVEEQVAKLDEQLGSPAPQASADPDSQPKPPWYQFARRVRRRRELRNAQREFRIWRDGVVEQVDSCCAAVAERKEWSMVAEALEWVAHGVKNEQRKVDELWENVGSVSETIRPELGAEVPGPLIVDRSILPRDRYDDFYSQLVKRKKIKVDSDTVSELLLSKKLLRGHRTLTREELGKRLERAAHEAEPKLTSWNRDDLDSQLELAGLIPKYRKLNAWLSHDLWEYAERLTKVHDAASPAQQRVECAYLQVPEIESLGSPPDRWVHGPNPPTVMRGAECSVHLCRVLQGFSLSDLGTLDILRKAYQDSPDRSRLHTVNDPEALPTLDGN